MCPVWLLVAVGIVGVATGAVAQCWEHQLCQEFDSKRSMMECLQLCHSDLSAETPMLPGDAHLQPASLSDSALFVLPPSSSSSSSSSQGKRSYSMEHFRWGKPVGRKRRPIKVYTSNGVEEVSAEGFPDEMRRRELANELLAAATTAGEEPEEGVEAAEEEEERLLGDQKDDSYKMRHFRWGGPLATKRYGGFMKSWDERGHQRPLLTLFKNVINKDGQQQQQQQKKK